MVSIFFCFLIFSGHIIFQVALKTQYHPHKPFFILFYIFYIFLYIFSIIFIRACPFFCCFSFFFLNNFFIQSQVKRQTGQQTSYTVGIQRVPNMSLFIMHNTVSLQVSFLLHNPFCTSIWVGVGKVRLHDRFEAI